MSKPTRTPINERALLTVDEAADYLSISRDQLDRFRFAKDIKPVPLGTRNLRYRRADLDTLIDAIEAGTTNLIALTSGRQHEAVK